MPLHTAFIVPHPPIVVPEVGQDNAQIVQTTIDNYHAIAKKIADINPRTLIITTPHQIAYADYFHLKASDKAYGNFASFGAPNINIKISTDAALIAALSKTFKKYDFPAGTLGNEHSGLDHGVTVPLYFIQQYLKDIPVVIISLSNLSRVHHYQLGQMIQEVTEELQDDIVFLASGDFSHKLKDDGPYGYAQEGEIFDDKLVSALKKGDFLEMLKVDEPLTQKAAECGLKSFIIMAGALDGYQVNPTFYSYEKPFGVGYGMFAFEPQERSPDRQLLDTYQAWLKKTTKPPKHPYVKLAKEALETYVKTQEILKKDLVNDQDSVPGIFVSLYHSNQLRGCIGTVDQTQTSLSKSIIKYAVEAGIHDPRFASVSKDELPFIEYRVDLLSASVPIENLDDQNVEKHGLIVENKDKSAVLLPDIEGIDDPQTQHNMVLKKAGIKPEESYKMYRFTVHRYQ